jgi:carbon monoxide dehydrogenase subunit G
VKLPSPPVVVELTEDMDAEPSVLWPLITDWERQGEWMLEASDFVVISAEREGVGVTAEATVRIGGLRVRDRVRVTHWEPPERLAIEHLGLVSGRGDLRLRPLGSGRTRFEWREELNVPRFGPLGSAALFIGLPLLRRTFRRDLKVLRTLAESRAS